MIRADRHTTARVFHGRKRFQASWLPLLTLRLSLLLALSGCSSQWATLRGVPRNPLVDELQLASWSGPQPTPRTAQLLRVYNLTDDLQGDPFALLEKLRHVSEQEPSADNVYAMAELAYLFGHKLDRQDPAKAIDLYGTSVLYAYAYLFDDHLALTRNCYDPQFRGACDLYNSGS